MGWLWFIPISDDRDERGRRDPPGRPPPGIERDARGEPRALPRGHAERGAAPRRRPARHAGPLRRRLLVPRDCAGRRPVGRGRRRGRVPRPDLLDRRAAGHAGRAGARPRRSTRASATATSPGVASPPTSASCGPATITSGASPSASTIRTSATSGSAGRNRLGIFRAVLSVLAGNWRPSLAVRLPDPPVLPLVALQRVLPIAPRGPRTPVGGAR